MDFNRLTTGSSLYLPVYQAGALFYTGDSHAVQGDGEINGTAIEASLTPVLQFVVHKGAGRTMKWPRAEDANNYYVMGMDVDLDVAMKEAAQETIEFLQQEKRPVPRGRLFAGKHRRELRSRGGSRSRVDGGQSHPEEALPHQPRILVPALNDVIATRPTRVMYASNSGRFSDACHAAAGAGPASRVDAPRAAPAGSGQVLVRVSACGVCRTDLHIVDGELPELDQPVVPGHEIVGVVQDTGPGAERFRRVSASASRGWAGPAALRLLPSGRENLCGATPASPATRSTAATPSYAVADARYCFPLPDGYSDAEAAPLLCAGLIGYRAWSWPGTRSGLASTASARPRTSSRRWRVSRAAAVRLHAAGRRAAQAFALGARGARGPASRRAAARAARRGDTVRAGGRAGAGGAARHGAGRHGRLRRHPHERHPVLPL